MQIYTHKIYAQIQATNISLNEWHPAPYFKLQLLIIDWHSAGTEVPEVFFVLFFPVITHCSTAEHGFCSDLFNLHRGREVTVHQETSSCVTSYLLLHPLQISLHVLQLVSAVQHLFTLLLPDKNGMETSESNVCIYTMKLMYLTSAGWRVNHQLLLTAFSCWDVVMF